MCRCIPGSLLTFRQLRQTREHSGDQGVPLLPIMTARNDVKFVGKPLLIQQRSEPAIHGQETLLISAGQEQIRRLCGLRRPCDKERIAAISRLAAEGPNSE